MKHQFVNSIFLLAQIIMSLFSGSMFGLMLREQDYIIAAVYAALTVWSLSHVRRILDFMQASSARRKKV